MNNWFLKFLVCGFLTLGVGLAAAWLSSFVFWEPHIQKGIGFLAAGTSVAVADIAIRRKLDDNGIYQEVHFFPFIPVRIPAWVFGIVLAVGGILLLFTKD